LRAPLAGLLNRAFVSIGLLTLVSGAIFAISGLVIFLHYRKENPVAYQEEA
jgi:quinol-cytochrome oxidoreductase complex cytochrome b subunit